MKAFVIALAALAALSLTATASADVTKLKGATWRDKVDLRPFDTVYVEDFADAVKKRLKDADADAKYHAEVAAAGARLADLVAERLVAAKAFARVERVAKAEPGVRGMVVGGVLTEFRDANLAGLYLGIGTGSKVRIEAHVRDGTAEKPLGRMKGVYATSFIPGVANLVQTANRFLDGLALRVADEILIAKGAKFREETGRQGRLREKYTD
jgi:hypothetical protein